MKKNVIFDIDDSKISRVKMAEIMAEQFKEDMHDSTDGSEA